MMNNRSTLATRKRLLTTLTAGALMGLLTSAPVTAAVVTTSAAVIGHAPTLTGEGKVTIQDTNSNKVPDVGDVLTVDEDGFTFSDPDGDAASTTTYEWTDGSNTTLGTGKTYTIAATDLGKTIHLKALAHTDTATTDPAVAVTAVEANIDTLDGTVATKSLTVVSAADVVSVTITGGDKPMVGNALTAVPVCAGGSCTSAKLTYVWSVESAPGTYTPITGQTSATYTPTKENQKKHIKVAVNTENAVHKVTRR